jgi:threonine dehydratase
MEALPQPEDVIAAEVRIRPHVPVSPLFPSPGLSAILGCDVWIKADCLSVLSSFKLRGALNHLLAAPVAAAAVTSSTGNHGQGVAYAARLLGRSAHVFVPHGSPETKRQAIARLGASLHVVGDDLDDAKDAARSFAEAHGLSFVDDGESAHVIAGAGTIGLEVGRDLPAADFVFAPVGAACLASGCALGLRGTGVATRVIGVQPTQSPCMIRSFHAGYAISHPVTTICDCLNQRIPPALSLATMIANVHDAIEVDDSECLAAMHRALLSAHMLVEVGTAAALAGAYARRAQLAGKTVVLLFSGANSDGAMIARALATPPLGALP